MSYRAAIDRIGTERDLGFNQPRLTEQTSQKALPRGLLTGDNDQTQSLAISFGHGAK